ncbi:MAG: hypothetical protein AAGF10_01860 [Verrucomicrobiota bacterium]
MKSAITATAFIILLFTSACQHKLSEEEKASLTTVSIADHEELEDSFALADGAEQPVAANVMATSVGGVAPTLFGALIDAGVRGYQQDEFEEQYSEYIQSVNQAVPRKIGDMFEQRAEIVLKEDPFFGPRYRDKSPNYFDGEITRYGLVRKYRTSEETYLEAQVQGSIWLMGTEGDRLFTELIFVRSDSVFTMEQLHQRPERMKQMFRELGDNFQSEFKQIIDKQMGREAETDAQNTRTEAVPD